MPCLPVACLLLLVAVSGCHGEPLHFDPFFGDDTAFFSAPDEDHFGAFSGFEFRQNAPSGVQLTPTYRERVSRLASSYDPQDSAHLPVYTDGSATPPQVTVSRLHKDYTSQLHRLANPVSRPIRPPSYQRIPKFRSEPFASASSNKEEQRKQPTTFKPTDRPTTEAGQLILPLSKSVELQTGFVPIIKGSGQDQSKKSSLASSVIKDIEPPILTAGPGSLTARPNLYKVSASVLSSTKVSPARQRQNATSYSYFNEVRPRPRQASYSRGLDSDSRNATVLAVSSSTSESVVSRVVSRPESILDLQQKDLLRLHRPSEVTEESKRVAKKTLDLNCEGSQDLGWCELGDRYPRKYVNQVIDSCKDVIDRMHVEVPHSFEKLSDTSDFKAQLDNSSSSSFREAKERGNHDAWSWAAYFHQGSLCDAETGFLRPETAKDSSGKWNIIVQTEQIKQRVPIEMCRKTNGSCKKMLACGLKSQCLQKYNYHLLLSLNPALKQDCPFMKLYRFPSACVCHVE